MSDEDLDENRLEKEPSLESYQSVAEAQDLNPEGYGIDDDFVPVAVFDTGEEEEEDVADESASEMEEGDEVIAEADLEGDEEEGEDEGEIEEGEEGEGEETKDEEEEDEEVESEEAEGEVEAEQPEAEQLEGEEKTEEEQEKSKEVKFGEEEEDKEEKKVKREPMRRRMSVRRKSIAYASLGRFGDGDNRRISGDFTAARPDTLEAGESPPSITSFQPEAEYSYEEITEEEELEEEPVDREYYYNVYKSLIPERNLKRMKNNFLHRKMAEYFRKRKMEHVLKETDQQVDSQQKYDKKLDALADLKEFDTRERNSITSELNDLRDQRNDQLSMLNDHFRAMQNREKEIGTGLINTKTGKEIPDKLVERLIKRQRDKMGEVAKMRLVYIKIRNNVTEKKNALHALDCIGENLHLIDYEQLKIENQSHTDKIEERDTELTRLRVKCSSAMQCLAHVREKSAAVLIDIQKLSDRLEDVEMEYTDCRERLNNFKQERDTFRADKEKLCEESGLLTQPKLLRDMEDAMEEVKIESEQLETLERENQRLRNSLQAIKKNISALPFKLPSFDKSSTHSRKKTVRIYRGRPTLIYPELPRSEWSDDIV